ncbi:PhoX family protein [Arsenicicoccus dermatophilus]|uniref:PhoX family protein n=1 Tax=Arsenicicoccus dermatophilus TaxID=1076331 RepID=UPI001F4D2F41|nr:PhoX family phosphatase [Arsenicicoccus dermatophilus]MCH8612736.1 PhoX family phosphatase [Arsenicicoccus dermatophilus]
MNSERPMLPMAGITHANRSAVTCHLRCGDACSQTIPNTSDNETFASIATAALSRRSVLGAAGALALAFGATTAGADDAAALDAQRGDGKGSGKKRPGRVSGLDFMGIAPVAATVDRLTVPGGFEYHPIIRWGDPILKGAPVFDPEHQTPAAQAMQFGYNNDYTDIIVTDKKGTQALLVCNHEYTNENIMFPPTMDKAEAIKVAWAAHGLSIVELTRPRAGERWSYRRAGRLNRRITLDTPFVVDGPAAGSTLLCTKEDPTGRLVRGTMNNCSGGTTPWGTVVSGEENFNQYFKAEGTSKEEKRYGLAPTQDTRGWAEVDPRWDARTAEFKNEPNRFGWIVEVDPMDPRSTPVKHTAMGRFKHEGANIVIADDGHAVAYMGDDEKFDYVYKFVSKRRYDSRPGEAARKRNLHLLSEGDLYVAQFTGDGLEDGVSDGSGEWIPLTKDGRSMVKGFTLEQVLVYTRLAADAAVGSNGKGPTKMDRPEDVQPNTITGRIYVVCTNNSDRGKEGKAGPDEANPRALNKDGHVVEITEVGGHHTGTKFSWNLVLVCGDPKTAGTYFGGYQGPVAPISCPDNVAFDSRGDMWLATDGMPSSLKYDDGLFHVELSGPDRGRVTQFLAVPTEAETCGPVVHDRDGSVFVAVQHPGEDGTWADQHSHFPDYVKQSMGGRFAGPRPTIVQVRRIG